VHDGVAFEFKVTSNEVAENERAPVADVREVIDGRPAAIHADLFAGGIKWREILDGARQCVEQFQTHFDARTVSSRAGERKVNFLRVLEFKFADFEGLQPFVAYATKGCGRQRERFDSRMLDMATRLALKERANGNITNPENCVTRPAGTCAIPHNEAAN
jgi:hypothetical protein